MCKALLHWHGVLRKTDEEYSAFGAAACYQRQRSGTFAQRVPAHPGRAF
jgi:hypothetical protein